jgi:phenylalanyl-tRNA synthetase beta chain
MNGHEIISFYAKDRNMKEFTDIIRDSEIYPVISDSNKNILSLPPLINSDHSKIKLSTKNVFIEMTATDITKAKIALNTFISMFS